MPLLAPGVLRTGFSPADVSANLQRGQRRLACGFILAACALGVAAVRAEADPDPAVPVVSPESLTPVRAPDGPVRLVGANGREVDFAGVWEARPEGLVVVTSAEAAPTLVPWSRFDLARLRSEQPSLDAARQRALFLRSPQPINLGLFAGLLTPSQVGSELRRALDQTLTVKVPLRYRTTTTSSTSVTLIPARPVIYRGILLPPAPDVYAQTQKTVSETRVSPDELTTSPRRVLDMLSRTEGIVSQDRRDLFDLVKANPVLLEELAASLDRIAASLPPRHLMAQDPTLLSLTLRLREFSAGLRALSTASSLNHADQVLVRDLLYLADSPNLR
jgi:hypothetical protein